MKPHFRIVAALLALFAFSAYFAEGVWASMCPPDMQKMGTEVAAASNPGDPPCPMAPEHASSHASDAPEHSGHEAPRCPLGVVGAGGSCVSVSLPATTSEPLLSLQQGASLAIAPEAVRDLLLTAAFFRPPIQ